MRRNAFTLTARNALGKVIGVRVWQDTENGGLGAVKSASSIILRMREEVEDELEAVAAVYAEELVFCHRNQGIPRSPSPSDRDSSHDRDSSQDGPQNPDNISTKTLETSFKPENVLWPVVLRLRIPARSMFCSACPKGGANFQNVVVTIGLPPEYPDTVPHVEVYFECSLHDTGENLPSGDLKSSPHNYSMISAILASVKRQAEECLSNGGVGAMLFQMIEAVRDVLETHERLDSINPFDSIDENDARGAESIDEPNTLVSVLAGDLLEKVMSHLECSRLYMA